MGEGGGHGIIDIMFKDTQKWWGHGPPVASVPTASKLNIKLIIFSVHVGGTQHTDVNKEEGSEELRYQEADRGAVQGGRSLPHCGGCRH
jgi:hypothetical protein